MIQTALSAKQERALVALMGAKSFDQAAAQVGVGQRTLRRWLQQDAFQEAFQKLRRAAMSSATAHLQNAAWDAVEALRKILSDDSAPQRPRPGLQRKRACLEGHARFQGKSLACLVIKSREIMAFCLCWLPDG